MEELYIFTQFLKSYGLNNLLISKKRFKINTDLPQFYLFNSKLNNIEDSDLILLIGINPRTESSMLNLKIRKHFFNKNIPLFLVGNFVNLTYYYTHLGNSLKTLINILEGKNSFCKHLRKAKNPLIIIGSEFTLRLDGAVFQNLIRFLSKKSFIISNTAINVNFVNLNISQMHACELGAVSNAKSEVHLLNSLKKEKKIGLICNNLNYLDKSIIKNPIFFSSLNTHRFEQDYLFNYILPINSFYERDSLNVNLEGIVQKGFKSKTTLNLSRNSEDVFRSIIFLDKILNTKRNNFLKKNLYLEAPFLKNIKYFRKKFEINFLNLSENANKVFLSNLKPIITNFYMTDNISKNSKTMAECSLFLQNKNNFI